MTGSTFKSFCLLCILLAPTTLPAVTYTVKQGGGANFITIQAAINMAGPGDEIVIMDTEIYDEQVTIDSTKSGLTLRSENPRAAKKPVIRYHDISNVNPKSYAESQDPDKITYCKNGALRIIGGANIRIAGITIDGDGAFAFAYPAVWGGVSPLFHGNAAVCLEVAGEVIMSDCEMRNAFYGIYCRDRNEGGVFANANPGDLFPENIIPYSGFSRVGNHLFEYNKIHNNSWGIYFESLWDMGSTVRYNLIYDNHHVTDDFAAQVAAMPSGNIQAGGAIVFRDVPYVPVAIYNNTFFHNFLNLAGIWQVGAQHLVFNNIYGEPFRLWNTDPNFPNPTAAIDQRFVNRMYNSVYACQAEAPETTTVLLKDSVYDAAAGKQVIFEIPVTALSRVRIMNGMEQVKKGMTASVTVRLSTKDTVIQSTIDGVIQPGNRITAMSNLKPFPENSNVRWAKIPFQSTDPANANFLVPDWSDSLVQSYIIDQGWQESGVNDPDGTPADIGALSAGGGRPVDIFTVRQNIPVQITATTALIGLSIQSRTGTMTDAKITMFRYVKDLDTTGQEEFISANNIISIPLSNQKIVLGSNTIDITNPNISSKISFFELIIEGTGSNGRTFTTATGFLLSRPLGYTMNVELLNAATRQPITETRAGDTCILKTSVYMNGQLFPNLVDPTDVKIQSRFDLLNPEGIPIATIPGGINGSSETEVLFTRVPLGGIEYVLVAGRWVNGINSIAFLGCSYGIRVHAGAPDSIAFTMRPIEDNVVPGTMYPLEIQVFDAYGNTIDYPTTVTCRSLQPEIGDMAEKEVAIDSTGTATLNAYVTTGEIRDTFFIVASLANGASAKMLLLVGDPSAVHSRRQLSLPNREYRCELIDLHGRVIKRTTILNIIPAISANPFTGSIGRGMYLVKLTDIKTGKTVTNRRLFVNR